jgi:hypothetical protein
MLTRHVTTTLAQAVPAALQRQTQTGHPKPTYPTQLRFRLSHLRFAAFAR